MSLAPGTRIGPYEVVSMIGAGGMGEVYRATDTNLGRQVAIKVLPDAFLHDPERLVRFEREAKTLASLSHPNIATIYGLEKVDGIRALVMELVEGPTLAERIAQGPIETEEALPVAKQIAEALEAAHEQGIIHRDLKPANIKVRNDGTVKVLDFGLAKVLEPLSGVDEPSSPTITSPAMTRMGVILGTAAYMSPEQAKGKSADKASDIWAFGCVLYEMLTGTRAFEGEDVSDTIANVLAHEPRWDRVPSTTPPAILVLLRRSLRKERKRRLQDAAGVRIEIEDALSLPRGRESDESPKGGVPRWRRAWLAGAALVGGPLIAGVVVWQLKPSPPATPQVVTRFPIPIPADEEIPVSHPAIALSPDATHLVYVARRRGVQQLHLRALDRLESKPMAGTEGASSPFFSPDGQWVGFFAQGKLKKIPITAGAAQILCDAGDPLGGSWAPNDIIYFAPGSFSGVWQVSANGGVPQPFTKLDPTKGEIGHRWPRVLPGSQAVLFTSRTGPGTDEWQIQVQRVSTGERRTLGQGESPYYVPTGHLVYIQTATGSLVARPFDISRLEVKAAAVVVADGILSGGEGAHYALSGNGMLAYVAGRTDFDDRTLVWVDRSGNSVPLQAPVRAYETPRQSPLGRQLAFMTSGPKFNVWVYNVDRGDAAKLISDGSDQFPVWTPDGKRLSYRATRTGTRNVWWRMADGTGTEERLTTGQGNHAPGSWSPNGEVLLFTDGTAGVDILSLHVVSRRTEKFLLTSATEAAPQFSPNGRWVAYLSNESGQEEIYVQPYPGPGRKWQISTDGGTEPVWNPNGRELFYRNGNKMMAVSVRTQPVFSPSNPVLLFTGDYVPASTTYPNYDVSRDGRRFLMVQPSPRERSATSQIVVVLNWHDELNRLVPIK